MSESSSGIEHGLPVGTSGGVLLTDPLVSESGS